MTEKVNPSQFRPAEAFKTAGAIAEAGGSGDGGYVVDGTSPTTLSTQDSGIDETVLNAFAQTSGATSLDVTIDPGEAFIYGSWLAIDTSTTVTLAASTVGQTVYVGWNKNGSNDVIIGLASAFASAAGDTDQKIPLFDFDTDGSGVTAVTDRRDIGYTRSGSATFEDDLTVESTLDVSNLSTLSGGLDLGGDVDLSGNQLTDTSQGHLDLTGDGNDLRLDTGQAIEDGSGTTRVGIRSTQTDISASGGFANGVPRFIASDTGTSVVATSGGPFAIQDDEGSYNAVQYDTDLNTGTLELTNANLSLLNNQIEDVNRILFNDGNFPSGDYFQWNSSGGSTATDGDESVQLGYRDNSAGTFTPYIIANRGGPVELPSHDLRLATGNVIEDGSGTARISFQSNSNEIRKDDGTPAISAISGSRLRFHATATEPVTVRDKEGGFTAVQYTTDLNTGTLELTTAYQSMARWGANGRVEWQTSQANDTQNPRISADGNTDDGISEVYVEDGAGNQTTLS